MIVSDSTLYDYFESKDKPNQQQFRNLIDSKRNVLDKIGIDDLSNDVKNAIQNIASTLGYIPLAAGTYSYTIPAGSLLEKIMVMEASEIAFSVGTSEGGQEVYETQSTENGGALIAGDFPCFANTTIYFNNVTETTTLKLYIR